MIHNLMSDYTIKNIRSPQRSKKISDFTNKNNIGQLQTNLELQPNMKQIKSNENIISNASQCFCQKITKMKEEALQKASQMIELLYEEKRELENQLQQLKYQLVEKENTILELQQRIQMEIKKQINLTPLRSPQPQIPKEGQSVVVNDIFFSFSQPKSRQMKGKSTSDRSTIEIKPGLTISKQFQPWQNHQNVIGTLVEVISRQEESINQLREVGQLVNRQLEQSEELNNQFMFQKLQVQQDLLLFQEQENGLSETKLTTLQSEIKIQNISDLIGKYQDTICRFRQYSAFLKASLCEAANFITKVGLFFNTLGSLSQNNLYQCCKMLQTFKKSISSVYQTHQQNQQLRNIIEQLVQNIEVLKANLKIE